MGSDEQVLKKELEELQKQLGKKQKFDDALSSLKSLLRLHYPSASPSLRKSFYSVVCRVATVLKTRYTSPGFWLAGLGLFQEALLLTSDSTEKEHLRNCIAQAKEHLDQIENPPDVSQNRGYLFEGHLTVDPEPPQPQWLVQSNILNSMATLQEFESSGRPVDHNTIETASSLLGELMSNLDDMIPEIMEMGSTAPRVPPASKEVVAKLPVVTITEEILAELGKDAECAICKENLVVNDKMQELPCKHKFHPPCLKPWLDEHNSCPICRHELKTDDHGYESWKEREKEAAEERRGAENAVRGGEFILHTFDEIYITHFTSELPTEGKVRLCPSAAVTVIDRGIFCCFLDVSKFAITWELRSCAAIALSVLFALLYCDKLPRERDGFSHPTVVFPFLSRNLAQFTFSNMSTSKLDIYLNIKNCTGHACNTIVTLVQTVMELATSLSYTSPNLTADYNNIPRMVSNGYAGRSSSNFRYEDGNTVVANTNYKQRQKYTQMESCLVIPPPKGRKPRAIIKFLGGAFIGAVPEVTYSCLIELLAKNGYVVILVPYNVTFDHSQAANQVYERFNACLHLLLESGLPHVGLTASELAGLPLFSVGHSNGALLQVLTGSYFSENIPKCDEECHLLSKANAIISFNNRPATEAVPYFEQLGPLVNQMMPVVEASPMYAMARSASGDAWKVLLDTAGAIIPDSEQEALISLTKFVDQLPSVFGQVTQGISEFKPSPSENRDCCRNSYNVQHTLLVKFNSDVIDETDVLEETLKPRVESIGGTIEKVQLSGNHITPCIQDPKWQVGYVYTPVDAIAQGLKTLSLNETKVLSRTICDWFRCFED
ncbi:hypothetical protein SADUNF_Sadunf06G0171100 [Salix dunnii]|uniref:RING-type E3 ubiquitin transferase n=1 Tax=Salix dunnii TaxID=1413687 RepID=A0A835K2P3_9ROSI|nr:hypothetical protein SADUNF_Sadunf06G0171100 [Salix dunnii]